VNAVLDELKVKGGDITEYQSYLNAVTGLRNIATTTSLIAVVTGWLRSSEGGVYWGKLLARAAIVFVVFWILSKFAGRLTVRGLNRHLHASTLLTNFARRTAGGVVFVIGMMIALAILGVPIGPLMAALGGGGFIVGFAFQETLGNFASGLLIMVYRPFDLGDYVNVGGVEGTVKKMSLVSTTLITLDNKHMIIPNKTAWGDTITNFTGEDTRRVDLVFGIGYEDDIQSAIDVLMAIATKHDLVLEDPAPVVRVKELADSSVNLLLLPWCQTPDYWTVHWDLTRQAKEEFDAAGISIPFPQRDIHVQEVPVVSHER
jgi:small conductance mechanosensitive channel